jgi:SSS family solute:Na+ symporter
VQLTALDWTMVVLYGVVTLTIGLAVTRRAGSDTREFFLSGRSLPWYLLGVSLVATTFSTDTPNLVTDLVRTGGVSQNWVWWAFLLTGMLTVFFYARLWRRSEALTDMAFYELRYSGRPAAFLRGFRAVYLGLFFNTMIMASVNLAAIKIAGVLLGVDRTTTVLVASGATALYAASAGLRGVVLTDAIQFTIAILGAFAAAYYAVSLPEVGGLSGLLSHPEVAGKLSLLPDFGDWRTAAAVFIVPVAVQWWSTWYPGAEPGGGGYVAQRILAARNEKESLLATLLFNVLHYGLRPWPWIIVALASLIVYPDLAAIQERFPHLDPSIVRHDLAYPAMLVYLPSGILGVMVASLAAAYMSTISTHLNWGASYIVDDCYRRFMVPGRDERHYVTVARVVTVLLVACAAAFSLWLENAYQAFQIMLQVVLVACERVERDRGDADLVRRGALVPVRARPVRSGSLGPTGARSRNHHGGMVACHPGDATDFVRALAGVLRPDPAHGPGVAPGGDGGSPGPRGTEPHGRGTLLVPGLRRGVRRAVRHRRAALRPDGAGPAVRRGRGCRGHSALPHAAPRGGHALAMQGAGDFHVPSALLGQAAVFILFAIIVWAFAREAARIVIRVALVVGVIVAVALLAGWLDRFILAQWLERIGEGVLSALEAVVGWLARAWARVRAAAAGAGA